MDKKDQQNQEINEETPLNQEQAQNQSPAADQEQSQSLLRFIPYYTFITDLCNKFDKAFVALLIVQNLNQGLFCMVTLATQDYFKVYLKLDPGVMTGYVSLIMFPWSVKILYGLISDNVPILGTRRKSYIILCGLVEFSALLALYAFRTAHIYVVVALLCLASLCMAFVNVVVDAIMCIQARKDPVHGSQDLFAIAWIAQGFGGVAGCLLGGTITEYYHPRYAFLIMSIMGVAVGINGWFLTKECELTEAENQSQEDEEGQREERPQEGQFWENLKLNLSHIGQALMMPEIYTTLSFFLLNGLTSPSFGQFSYFFMLNTAHITKFQFAMLGVLSRICHILGTMYYKAYLKDVETRTIIFWATAISVVSTFIHYAFAMRYNLYFGISDIVFVIGTDVVFGCLALAMNVLPGLALFAKITPPGIEGTIFAFLTGSWNFADGVLSPLVGATVNKQFVGVSASNMKNYHTLCLIAFVCSFTGFLLVPLIPLSKDIEKIQTERKALAEGKENSKAIKDKEAAKEINEKEKLPRQQVPEQFAKSQTDSKGTASESSESASINAETKQENNEEQDKLLQGQ